MALPGQRLLNAAQRAHSVTVTLVRFGFGEFVVRSGLDRLLPDKEEANEESAHTGPVPVRVRMLLEELGPTYIKAGQILSTRPDLIPPEWVDEFAKLQSNVPAVPWEGEDGIREALELEYGDELETLFESIDEEPIAAASMAQVHRATVRGGGEVVLKVLRPGIRETIEADLDLSLRFARIVKPYLENLGFDTEAVIDEFSRQLRRETDLTIEAASTERMGRDFAENEDIGFPIVHRELSTRSVLALELVKGTLLAHLDPSTLSDDRRETIVRHCADMVFRQCLEIGFFHADPHPGNIFVQENDRLCFIDCGMTGLIDPGTIGQLAQIVHGAISGDLDRVVNTAIVLADADAEVGHQRDFRSDVWIFVDQFHAGSLESIRLGELLGEFFSVLRKHHLHCPADIVFLIKALTTIEGVAQSIAPDFDLVGYVRPYVERLIRQRFSLDAMRKRLEGAFVAYGDMIEALPRHVSEISRSVRQNRLSFTLEHKGSDKLTREIERASMNISWALVIGSLLIGSALLAFGNETGGQSRVLAVFSITGFVVAIGLAVVRLLMTLRKG